MWWEEDAQASLSQARAYMPRKWMHGKAWLQAWAYIACKANVHVNMCIG